MRPGPRSRVRLMLRDASATAAFASIVLSGSVPAWAVAAFALALLTSLFGRRPLSQRPTVSVVILLVTGALLFGAAFRGMIDLVVAACTFAGLVTSHRLLSDPTPGTDQQVHLTSLLTLSGGAALTGELWFGACLFAFALCSSLSLGLGVLESPQTAEEQIPVRPALARIGLGTAFAVAGGIVFFVLFPRLSWNVAARRSPPGFGATTGMSDRVRLGGAGDIKSSPVVVARVTLTPDPKKDRLDAYWPGRAFDTFDGHEWIGSGTERPARPQVMLVQKALKGAVGQLIELTPAYGSRTLIGLERPVMFNNATGLQTSNSQRVNLVQVAGEEVHFQTNANAFTYQAYSQPTERLPPEPLGDDARFTQLPEGIDPRVKQLAETVLRDERRPLQAAARLQTYLQREYQYTLELGGNVDDPLIDFLFVRKAGHCEHFATALTALLRSVGLPARVSAGFYGGERIGELYVIRAGDAHAWTQVYVPNQGWEIVDATPESGRSNQPARLLAWLTDRYEELQGWWRARVVDYTFQDQVNFARALVKPPEEGGRAKLTLPSLPSRWAMLAALFAGALVYVLVQRLARRGRAKRHVATSFLDEIEERLRRAGIPRLPDEAIEEMAARLAEGHHPIAPALRAATRAYLGARFGAAPLPAQDRRSLLEALR